LIDNTGSLRTQFKQVLTFGDAVVRQTREKGPVSIFSFASSGDKRHQLAVATLGIASSQDEAVLHKYIENLFVQPGQTALMDAIYTMAEGFQAKTDQNSGGDRVIILITDGEDRISKVKEKQLTETLKDRGVRVYAIGMIQELDDDTGLTRKSTKEKATEFLQRITKETGGRVYFPKSENIDSDTLVKLLLAR